MYKKLLLVLFLLMITCGMAIPEKGGGEVEVRFTEIVVKVRPDAIVMPEGDYRAPLSEIEIHSDELKALNRKFNLFSIERMFARKKSDEKVGEEYPEREARAPEDVEKPDIENTFLLKFPDLISANAIVNEYERLEDVIYAEENAVLDIY